MIQQKHISSSEGSSDEDTVEELDNNKLIAMKKDKVSRTSVSAEAYGQFNKKVIVIIYFLGIIQT